MERIPVEQLKGGRGHRGVRITVSMWIACVVGCSQGQPELSEGIVGVGRHGTGEQLAAECCVALP
jgi:hypothetical protein